MNEQFTSRVQLADCLIQRACDGACDFLLRQFEFDVSGESGENRADPLALLVVASTGLAYFTEDFFNGAVDPLVFVIPFLNRCLVLVQDLVYLSNDLFTFAQSIHKLVDGVIDLSPNDPFAIKDEAVAPSDLALCGEAGVVKERCEPWNGPVW